MSSKEYLDFVANTVNENYLIESSTSADIGKFQALVVPLVQKIYPQMLTSQICDVQPLKSPVGRIAALHTYYKPDISVELDNGRIVTVTGGNVLALGADVISSSGGAGKVVYSEPKTNTMLIRFDVGGAFVGDTINVTLTVTHSTINRAMVKKLFGNYSLTDSEIVPVRAMKSVIRTMPVETKARKLRTTFTMEQVQDFQTLYGEKAPEITANVMKNEIVQEIDMETIDYMRTIATPIPDLVLQNSYGVQGDLMALGNDLYFSIFRATELIVKATKRNRTMFILADPISVALLLTNPLHSKIKDEDENNPFYVGKLGIYPLYCDIYAKDHYVVVGYRGVGDGDGDVGLIYSPYVDYLATATDPENFHENIMFMSRYAVSRHSQDQGDGIGDSDFFRSFAVDYTNVNNLIADMT